MLKKIVPFLICLTVPTFALAQATPVPEDPSDIFNILITSFKGGEWSIFASVCIMALVWLATKAPGISGLIKGPAKVWVAAISGTLLAVAATVFTTGSWVTAIGSGLSVGLGATGLFELVKRVIAKKPIDNDGDGVLDEIK